MLLVGAMTQNRVTTLRLPAALRSSCKVTRQQLLMRGSDYKVRHLSYRNVEIAYNGILVNYF